jgi:hypothetical protein
MRKILAVITFSAATALAGAAQAKDFPNWPLSLTCKSGDDSCARFEIFARGQISGTWKTLPPGARALCLSETQKFEKSYRLLQDCLSNAMHELLKNQQRKSADGEIVQLTPKAKIKPPPVIPATPAPEPASVAAPASEPASPPAPAPEPTPASPAPPPAEPAPQTLPETQAAPSTTPQ